MQGKQIGTFVLEQKLGEGGMAEVWKARHQTFGTVCAVKFLLPRFAGQPEFEKRFVNEGKSQAKLDHPNIVYAQDFLYVDGRSYLVMKYVDGGNLEHYLNNLQRPMTTGEALHLSRQILNALKFAHQRGVVHRDIKPSNILMDRNGQAYLMDFGIALVSGEARYTQTGTTIGTPDYMSPEQIKGTLIDARSDIYSFGVLLYEALTLRVPFRIEDGEGTSNFLIQSKHLHQAPPAPSLFNREIHPGVEAVIMKCLAKDPDGRYVDCGAVLEALAEIYSEGTNQSGPAGVSLPNHQIVIDTPVIPAHPSHEPAGPRPANPGESESVSTTPITKPWKINKVAIAIVAGVTVIGVAYFRHTADPKVETPRQVSKPVQVEPRPVEKPPVQTQPEPEPIEKKPNKASVDPRVKPQSPPEKEPPVVTPQPVEPAPENPQTYIDKGMALHRIGNLNGSREAFHKAAELGSPSAMVLEGIMMTQGEGGPKDDEAAVQRFRQASSMGYKRGTYNLAIMYDKGAGVPRDIEKAKQLYKQAGTPEAQTRLEQLNAPVGPGGFRKK